MIRSSKPNISDTIKCPICESDNVTVHRLERRGDKTNLRTYRCDNLNCKHEFKVEDRFDYDSIKDRIQRVWRYIF